MKFSKINSKNDPIVFSATVTKLHRSDPNRSAERALILTSKHLYVLDNKSFDLCDQVPLDGIKGLSFSPYGDGLLAIHIENTEKRDYLLSTEQYLYEIVGTVVLTIKEAHAQRVPMVACVSAYVLLLHCNDNWTYFKNCRFNVHFTLDTITVAFTEVPRDPAAKKKQPPVQLARNGNRINVSVLTASASPAASGAPVKN